MTARNGRYPGSAVKTVRNIRRGTRWRPLGLGLPSAKSRHSGTSCIMEEEGRPRTASSIKRSAETHNCKHHR